MLPYTHITPLLRRGVLTAQEAAFAYAAWKWTYHFASRLSGEIATLTKIIKGDVALSSRQTEALGLVGKLR